MSSINLNQLFPQLKVKQDHYFTQQEFQSMPYFKQLSSILPSKDLYSSIKKCKKYFRLISIKKGTVIYTSTMPSNSGYFLCHGSVTLLIKKSNRQKLQSYPRHILHQIQERTQYLNSQYGIPINLCQSLMNQFYQQKVMFKFLEYQKIYGQGYFGFSDMIKNNTRAFTVIATQDTILLEIQKNKFELSLKQLQLKKQSSIIETILQNVTDGNKDKQQSSSSANICKQLGVKLSQFFNYFVIKNYEKDQIIFKQNHTCNSIYFILKGQVQLTKSFNMDIPKKLIKDQNKPQIPKQIQIKVSRLSEKCYLGEVQYFLHSKIRQFTATSTQNNTILIQIQPTLFMKLITQFTQLQKDITISAKQKFSLANQNYLKQKNKVIKLFKLEFQNIQNKKKQKILSNLLIDDQSHKNQHLQSNSGATFQIFSKEGMFFRDTYERLQGFQEFQQNQANNKRAAIRKYKVQTTYQKGFNEDKQLQLQNLKYPSISINRDHDQNFQEFDSKEKLLYSPKKNINFLDLMSSAPISPSKQIRNSMTSHESVKKINRRKSVGKFHELQKDEAVFKRVLIKNGRFEQDKTTFKANIMKPIVHPKFDEIIKQCMSRKNQVIRKAIGDKKIQYVKDSYQSTIQSLKNKSLSISKFSNVSLTCKGTDEFKKKLDMFNKNHRKSDSSSAIRHRIAIEQETLQACIGFNEPPKSSYQKNRISQQKQKDNKRFTTTIETSNHIGFGQRTSNHFQQFLSKTGSSWIGKKNSPQKLVLLNHMMKPMTYSSVQY